MKSQISGCTNLENYSNRAANIIILSKFFVTPKYFKVYSYADLILILC